MRGMVVIVLLAALAAAPRAAAGERRSERRSDAGGASYESPLFTLLTLPATLLIRAASTLSPEEPAPKARDTPRPGDRAGH